MGLGLGFSAPPSFLGIAFAIGGLLVTPAGAVLFTPALGVAMGAAIPNIVLPPVEALFLSDAPVAFGVGFEAGSWVPPPAVTPRTVLVPAKEGCLEDDFPKPDALPVLAPVARWLVVAPWASGEVPIIMVLALCALGLALCFGAPPSFISSLPHAEQNFTPSPLAVPHILHVIATSITSHLMSLTTYVVDISLYNIVANFKRVV
jgi:hypothetical protein